MDKTQRLILEVLGNDCLEAGSINNKLKEIGHDVTYNTIAKNLKNMVEKNLLTRKAKGRPWNYYYGGIK